MDENETSLISVDLTEDEIKYLKQYAIDNNLSINDAMCHIVNNFINLKDNQKILGGKLDD